MVNNVGREWANEIITNRVAVSKNAHSVRVSIKAPAFAMGNNFLTLCITVGALAECAIIFLMIKTSINLAILIPGFIALGVGLSLVFVKLWLWHNFGEELINIKGNNFEMHRNYGLYKSGVSQLILDGDAELYTNRNDTWSWGEFRGKGIFRLATTDAKLTDFGLKLEDAEYEMILRPIADQLKSLKKRPPEVQRADTGQSPEVTEPVLAEPAPMINIDHSPEGEVKDETQEVEVEQAEEQEEEVLQPPSLAQQTEGQHRNVLNDYLEKAKDGKAASPQKKTGDNVEKKA